MIGVTGRKRRKISWVVGQFESEMEIGLTGKEGSVEKQPGRPSGWKPIPKGLDPEIVPLTETDSWGGRWNSSEGANTSCKNTVPSVELKTGGELVSLSPRKGGDMVFVKESVDGRVVM